MSAIEEIEKNIRNLIRVNESIVSSYDSQLLCSDYENTVKTLKDLNDRKKELIGSLRDLMNAFFEVKSDSLSNKFKFLSFQLIPTVAAFEFKFNLPRNLDKTSRQYFCYVSLMDRLVREYDVISNQNGDYYILDITASLNLKNLFKGD